MAEGIRFNGKMGSINKALHAQRKLYGNISVGKWLKVVQTFPAASRQLVADMND